MKSIIAFFILFLLTCSLALAHDNIKNTQDDIAAHIATLKIKYEGKSYEEILDGLDNETAKKFNGIKAFLPRKSISITIRGLDDTRYYYVLASKNGIEQITTMSQEDYGADIIIEMSDYYADQIFHSDDPMQTFMTGLNNGYYEIDYSNKYQLFVAKTLYGVFKFPWLSWVEHVW